MGQQGSGVLRTLQGLLSDILVAELELFYETPPEGPRALREECYDLYLPVPPDPEAAGVASTAQNVQRRYVLSKMLNGDITDESCVQHYCQYGCCLDYNETLHKLRKFVSWALLPRKCPRFARSRWVNQEPAIEWCGLLSCHHGLLAKVLRRWVGRPTSAPAASNAGCDPAALQDVDMEDAADEDTLLL